MKPIDLEGFDAKFRADADPWRTFTDAGERRKRDAILRGLGPGPLGRVWEPASGAGANSKVLARRSLRLDATEGAPAGVALTAAALRKFPRGHAAQLRLPARPPRTTYDAVVVAEVLYYLTARDMACVALQVAHVLRPGGRLVLAHHRIDFHDFAQHARGVHARFLSASGARWRRGVSTRNLRWIVEAFTKTP